MVDGYISEQEPFAHSLSFPKEGLILKNDATFPEAATSKTISGEDVAANRKAPEIVADALEALPNREQIIRDIYGIHPVVGDSDTTGSTSTDRKNCFQNQDFDKQKDTSSMNQDSLLYPPTVFLEERLRAMKEELERFRSASAWNLRLAGLDLAESQNGAYTQNPTFRLKFLRCDRWDATKAAARFIRYFDWKLELFGQESLAREITLEDLRSKDREMLQQGYLQRLPVRDRAGRAVFCSIWNGQIYQSPESLARIYFYMGSVIDEETDIRGAVSLSFKVKDFEFETCSKPFGGCLYMHRFGSDIPIRFEAMHKFMEKENRQGLTTRIMHTIVDYSVAIFNPEWQARTKLHYGSYKDWMEEIMAHGIPSNLIPFTNRYNIKTKNHLEYLSMRQQAEQSKQHIATSSTAMTDLPNSRDVLFGKGPAIQFSPGNQKLANLISNHYLKDYQNSTSKAQKTALAVQIVQVVKAQKGRFLSRDNANQSKSNNNQQSGGSIWLEVSDNVAREKVSQMLWYQGQKTKKTSSEENRESIICSDSSTLQTTIAPNLLDADSQSCSRQVTETTKRVKL